MVIAGYHSLVLNITIMSRYLTQLWGELNDILCDAWPLHLWEAFMFALSK